MLDSATSGLQVVNFSVDSALLAELGERLVGQSHIALAELIKNSYDADAEIVKISFGDDEIVIEDNGHGMTPDEFVNYWMRIGTSHKQGEQTSRGLQRPLTGAKGIGRLAVQFLGRKLYLESASNTGDALLLSADVDWDEAVSSGELTSARAECKVSATASSSFVDGSRHGTKIVVSGLNQRWNPDHIEKLAKEIWALQPPFLSYDASDSQKDDGFKVVLDTPDEAAEETFEKQMRAILEIWTARIRGELRNTDEDGNAYVSRVVVELDDGKTAKYEFIVGDSELDRAQWEIRVFNLNYRQPYGIAVSEARGYFSKFGGVHVYDADFHVPYYGVDTDWLGIEQAHSHRLSDSKLLPTELKVPRGMNDLPTNSRLFGVVRVDTAHERAVAEQSEQNRLGEHLSIQPSRDRLVDNRAYKTLAGVVRQSLDYYAMVYRQRQVEKAEPLPSKKQIAANFQRVEEVLEQYEELIPEEAYGEMRSSIAAIERDRETERRATVGKINLLSALASVGISSLAFQHELNRMYSELETLAREFKRESGSGPDSSTPLVTRLESWIERSKSTRSLFSHMLDEENRQKNRRFKVRALVENVYRDMGTLTRGVTLDADQIDPDMRLPAGTYAEWTAVFQNVLSNAINALLDTPKPERYIGLEASCKNRRCHLTIQDNGAGIDQNEAERFFQPFERGLELSPERTSLGTGGTGLGLTIVRTIAENLGGKVAFVEPSGGFSTAFQLTWEEAA